MRKDRQAHLPIHVCAQHGGGHTCVAHACMRRRMRIAKNLRNRVGRKRLFFLSDCCRPLQSTNSIFEPPESSIRFPCSHERLIAPWRSHAGEVGLPAHWTHTP